MKASRVDGKNVYDGASRDDLGIEFCVGEGIEIGAGTRPTRVAKESVLHFADKRTPEELRSYFATDDVVTVKNLNAFAGSRFDFVIAHHVLEHSANVIQTLIEWMSLLKDNGVLFISLPNKQVTPDAARLLTPPTHFVLDYLYKTSEDDYESREHICSFLWGWIDVGGLAGKTKQESACLVSNALNSDTNDLHWHTFNAATMKFVVETAAALACRTVEIEVVQDGFRTGNEHRLVCRLHEQHEEVHAIASELLDIKRRLRPAVMGAALEYMDEAVTYSLSKEHKGKLFLVKDGRAHWVRSPQTLKDKGLDNRDYAYLELCQEDANLVGSDIAAPDRKQAVVARLHGRESRRGIELSPGAVPIVDKDSFNVVYVDKFDHSVSDTYLDGTPVRIDTLLGDKLIDEVLEHETYSYIISSHVIEHIPDFIQFFKSAANVLVDGARLIMYVPDKRYTFDVLRSESTIDQIEEAHRQGLRHPSRNMAMDVYARSDFAANVTDIWEGRHIGSPSHKPEDAERIVRDLALDSADMHCFTFTPESFRGLIKHIIAKHVPVFEIVQITDTPYGQNEFLVDLVVHKEVR